MTLHHKTDNSLQWFLIGLAVMVIYTIIQTGLPLDIVAIVLLPVIGGILIGMDRVRR